MGEIFAAVLDEDRSLQPRRGAIARRGMAAMCRGDRRTRFAAVLPLELGGCGGGRGGLVGFGGRVGFGDRGHLGSVTVM
jgi:hypothetical protein